MSTYKTEGFVLKKQAIGEVDRLYSIFTLDHGKIEAVADGSAKITSKLAGDLEPFNICQLMIAKGKYFERVAGAQIIKKFDHSQDWTTLILAWALAEGLSALTINHLPEPQIYHLLKELLNLLNSQRERIEKIFLLIQFFWLALLILGQRPKINFQEDDSGEIIFDNASRNFFDQVRFFTNQKITKNYLPLPKELLIIMQTIDESYETKQKLNSSIKIAKPLVKNFYYLLINHYQLLTNRQFNSFQFLAYV